MPCCRQPLSESTRRSPSGESTMAKGMFPAADDRPAGSRHTPVGKHVWPLAAVACVNSSAKRMFVMISLHTDTAPHETNVLHYAECVLSTRNGSRRC